MNEHEISFLSWNSHSIERSKIDRRKEKRYRGECKCDKEGRAEIQ